jgi:hypothetical protein
MATKKRLENNLFYDEKTVKIILTFVESNNIRK